ncbi:MAG: endolytic transglycosylase MltG, partial [Gemmatimonadaceae bacterium]
MRFDFRTSRSARAWAAGASLVALAALAGCGGEPHGAPVRVIIPQRSSFSAAADSLARAGIVGQKGLFRLYAKLTGRDRRVKPGTYLLQRGTSWGDVLAALTEGKGMIATVTIPEGWALAQIVPQLAKKLQVPEDSVAAAVRDTAQLHRLDVPTPTLEGYLFPSTYGFPPGTTARQAVAEMVRTFERQWKPEWTPRLDTILMSRHDVLTLASIVEREARRPEERPAIAGVYVNRLRRGMRLEADPTVQYARGQHTSRVLYKDLEIDSKYNTYRYAGLPPGPIGSPGVASIQAALYPANVPYLFFSAHPDGHHE